jgi:glycosyltransferase involved in cell wall biosynthesis
VAADISLRMAHLIETDGPGGAERALAHLATQLQASGHYNLVCLPAAGEGWLGRELAGSGVAIEPIHLVGVPTRQSVRELVQAFRRHRVEVAHSHEFTMAVSGAWAARAARIPHVITMHGSRYYAERWRRRLALRAAVALSGQIVTVSRSLGDALSHDLWIRRARVATIPNGVPRVPPGSPTLRHELQLAPTDRLLLAVGNLYPVKGHLHLLEAVALLTARYPTAHLAIAGRGALEPALRARAMELAIARRVHLLGLRSDVPDLLAAADVYVLPSLSEGLPLSLLEAMFAGCPVVASAVGDVPDALAAGEAGLLVEPGDAAALAAAIARLLEDPSRARLLGTRAGLRAAAQYGVSEMVARYTALYCQLLRRGTDDRDGEATVSYSVVA